MHVMAHGNKEKISMGNCVHMIFYGSWTFVNYHISLFI
jgi:hypothetical protein